MKHLFSKAVVATLFILLSINVVSYGQDNEYTQRFLEMYKKINDPANGYFSKDGVPYHSTETLIAEAPDHGHETTSEAYSYWIWLDAMYGGVTKDWKPLNNSWAIMEKYAIPTADMQPTSKDYSPTKAATYAGEFELPSLYPAPLDAGVPVGVDPVSPDLTATYGSDIYGMHWLFDCDNFYGYGNKGDGVSTPSYMNTFQRGVEESVWKTIPHPSWEAFKWGKDDGTGFLSLYVKDTSKPAAQWRYTAAPDADARVVQAMYWAAEFVKAQGGTPKTVIPLEKASKMGDFARLSFFDKYFKPMGVQSASGPGATGYESAHYLISWYYAWGGPLVSQSWAWRIGCSHNHFGYQNPVAAYALSQVADMKPKSVNGARDWAKSYDRQLEFYTWLQSTEGGIAGGATNSFNGRYDKYPAGKATFYDMAYEEQPVYHDPGSNDWFGMQAWSMERVAEIYYINNDPRAKKLLDKWVPWAISEVKLLPNGDFQIPANLKWSGQPNTWTPLAPTANTGLHVQVIKYGTDLGITAALAKTLSYYAAATEKYGTLNTSAKNTAQELLDRMWKIYYEPTGAGVASEEERGDFKNFFDIEVYVPAGWTGKMANGDVIKNGVKFIDLRSNYRKDKSFAKLEAAYATGDAYKSKFHRFWAQADIALAYAEFGRLFKHTIVVPPVDGVSISQTTADLQLNTTLTLKAAVTPFNALNKNLTWSSDATGVATVLDGVVTAVKVGTATITAKSVDGNFTATCVVNVIPKVILPTFTVSGSTVGSGAIILTPLGGTYDQGSDVTIAITPANGWKIVDVKVNGVSVGVVTSYKIISIKANATISATFVEGPPCTLLTLFEVPRTTALPTVNTDYEFKNVQGTGGPSLSNVTKFSINWDLPNNGLYSFALNTTDGKPDYYVSLTSKLTQTMSSASPAIKITGSGVTGLDGDYWVNVDGANFVMVAKDGSYAIYFSKTSAAPKNCTITSGLKSDYNSFSVSVSPNPISANGTFTVHLNTPCSGTLSVFDAQGVERAMQSFEEQESVSVNSTLSNGIYFLRISVGDNVVTKKIIVR